MRKRSSFCHPMISLLISAVALPALSISSLSGQSGLPSENRLPLVMPNENRTPAGELVDGVLSVQLEARRGVLYAQGEDGPGFEIQAFGEVGGDLQAPGPLIRVPAGTEVRLTLDNTLESAMMVRGLSDRGDSALDSTTVAAGETREFRFRATVPGTYYYWGKTREEGGRFGIFEDGQLTGAIVVDPPGTPADDRILLISLWVSWEDVQEREAAEAAGEEPEGGPRHTFLVNGLSWPFTERLEATVGDPVRLRVINASPAPHPMHLHGFYYSVDARGDARLDTLYTPEQRRLAVTEHMRSGRTMGLSWLPKREGHWLFHCHFIAHISPEQHVRDASQIEEIAHGETGAYPEGEDREHESEHEHAFQGMAGLMTGVLVSDPEGKGLREDESVERRKLRVYANAREGYFGEYPAFSYILQEGPEPPAADSLRIPGTPIILARDEPVEVTVVNRTPVPITVHWHGIELDSYYDGIAGWSGTPGMISPPIPARDSFVVKFTPYRAGTFIYHTHMEEAAQLSSGLYAPLIVLEPGEEYDPETDHVFLVGWGGPGENAPPFLNGSTEAIPVELSQGKKHLFRFINITPSNNQSVRLLRGEDLVEWRKHGKDGAKLPDHQAVSVASEQFVGAGETYDFEVTAGEPEELTLEVTMFVRGGPPVVMMVPVIIR